MVLSSFPHSFPRQVWLLWCGTAVIWDQPSVRMICNNLPWEVRSFALELLSAQPWSLPQPCSCLDGSLTELNLLTWLPGLPQLCLMTLDPSGDLDALLTLGPIPGFPLGACCGTQVCRWGHDLPHASLSAFSWPWLSCQPCFCWDNIIEVVLPQHNPSAKHFKLLHLMLRVNTLHKYHFEPGDIAAFQSVNFPCKIIPSRTNIQNLHFCTDPSDYLDC